VCSSDLEDKDTSFSNPTAYTSYDTTSPYTYDFTNKPNGTYCYRVNSSAPQCVTVSRSTSAVLRIVNSTHYDMIDVRLNDQQKVVYGYAIPVGTSFDFVFTTPGTVTVKLGVGFYDLGVPSSWFNYTTTANLTAGQTTTVTFPNPTIGQLLSKFQTNGRDFEGPFNCYAEGKYGSQWYHFWPNGSWIHTPDDGAQTSGTFSLVSWPDYSSIVQFKLCSTCSSIYLSPPWDQFIYTDGPSCWNLIEYTGQ